MRRLSIASLWLINGWLQLIFLCIFCCQCMSSFAQPISFIHQPLQCQEHRTLIGTAVNRCSVDLGACGRSTICFSSQCSNCILEASGCFHQTGLTSLSWIYSWFFQYRSTFTMVLLAQLTDLVSSRWSWCSKQAASISRFWNTATKCSRVNTIVTLAFSLKFWWEHRRCFIFTKEKATKADSLLVRGGGWTHISLRDHELMLLQLYYYSFHKFSETPFRWKTSW